MIRYVLLLLLLFGLAMWWAESPVFSLLIAAPRVIAVAAVAVLACMALGAAALRAHAVIGALLVLIAMAAGAAIGAWSWRRAYNECVTQAPLVQSRIDAFHRQHGRHPATLAEAGPLPCRTILHGSILRYRRTASGYDLGFSDWLIKWHGNERQPMFATK
jgi:hypothetical protein